MNAVEEGQENLDWLKEHVEKNEYNCSCQAGGVDAISIDTDWLRWTIMKVEEAFAVMKAATSDKSLTESDEYINMARTVEFVQYLAIKWADPSSYVHTTHSKTFLAEAILEHLWGTNDG